ncbi:hypothetical protein P7C71_g2043, partial [Lecanoromycetidae sp. Uapishka_2]
MHLSSSITILCLIFANCNLVYMSQANHDLESGCQPAFGTCSGIPSPTTTSINPGPTSVPTTLQDCLAAQNVPVFLASSSGFSQLAQPYNLRLVYTPAVIVVPTTTQHIIDAVLCASANNVKIQAKSGGHSYASFSSGGQNGSMVIDLESLQTVTVDTSGIAQVGGGVRLGDMALAIYNQSQRALPHGTCPGVGIGGHASHGGFGYSSRLWGLTLDTIVGLDVVLANGSYIHTTSTAYPDIFYALRGAADSFGIITSFYLQTQPAPSSVVNWSYGIPDMFTSAAVTAEAFVEIQNFALNASVVDGKLGLGIYIDGTTFSISGTYIGDEATFTNNVAPALLSGLPTPSTSSIKSVDWITSLTDLANNVPLQQPITGYNLHDDFFAKSVVVPSSSPLTTTALTSYFNYIIETGLSAPSPWFSIINLYGGPDSQINIPSPSSTAYSDRSALWVIQHYGYTGNTGSPFPPTELSFIDGLNTAITSAMPDTTFLAYSNYVDPSLTPAEAHSLYFDAATYDRLLTIKDEVDPGHVFWNPQSIGN